MLVSRGEQMKRAGVLALLFCIAFVVEAAQRPRVILAVFAHPDDETFAGPILARYAHEGVKVYLAIATNGETGVREHAGIPAGEQLGKVRRAEAVCACRELGVQSPIFFDLANGQIGAVTTPKGKNVQIAADRVESLISQVHPDVVITWGPEGGYGHPDHRLVSAAVSQVIQASKNSPGLLYVSFSTDQAKLLNDSDNPWRAHWNATDPSYLTVRVTFAKRDETAYHRALECHKSQFTTEEMQKFERDLDKGWAGSVLFRPWFGKHRSNSVFN
jgi:LmbE family N-acetylglucosaminyl deacetylase